MGDYLAGRFFSHRLFPITPKEFFKGSKKYLNENEFKKMLSIGGFPEPFLKGSEIFITNLKVY